MCDLVEIRSCLRYSCCAMCIRPGSSNPSLDCAKDIDLPTLPKVQSTQERKVESSYCAIQIRPGSIGPRQSHLGVLIRGPIRPGAGPSVPDRCPATGYGGRASSSGLQRHCECRVVLGAGARPTLPSLAGLAPACHPVTPGRHQTSPGLWTWSAHEPFGPLSASLRTLPTAVNSALLRLRGSGVPGTARPGRPSAARRREAR